MQYPIPHKRRLFHCKHIGTVLTFAEFSIKILLIAPFACGEGAKTSTHDTPKESCLLLSVDDGSFDAEGSLLELRRLAESAGATVFAVVEQKREIQLSSQNRRCIGTYAKKCRLAQIGNSQKACDQIQRQCKDNIDQCHYSYIHHVG